MKQFKVMYRSKLSENLFGKNVYGEWHFYSEHTDMLSAKRAVKAVKKWLGRNGGSVKIVTE